MADGGTEAVAAIETVLTVEKIVLKILDMLDKLGVSEYLERRLRSLWDLLKLGKKTLVLVGGGELAVEMAIACRRVGWKVRCISSGDEINPMRAIPLSGQQLYADVRISPDVWDIDVRLETYVFPEVAQVLWSTVADEPADLVVLEDAFLSRIDWERTEQWPVGVEEKPVFVPSCKSSGGSLPGSAMLSRTDMRNAIEGLDTEILNEGRSFEEEDQNSVEQLLDEMGGFIVIKPDTTSSGHGQSFVHTRTEIGPAFEMLGKRPRAEVNRYIVERGIDPESLVEAFVIVVRDSKADDGFVTIGPIEYEKLVKPATRIGGPFRLRYAAYPCRFIKEDTQASLAKLAMRVAAMFDSPFIGVEFLVSNRRYWVNEVTWRPDDSGYVTLLSHSPSQFDLFLYAIAGRSGITVEPKDGQFICKPILRNDPWDFYPPRRVRTEGPGWMVRFYQKGSRAGRSALPRVCGYYIVNTDQCSVSSIEKSLERICENVLQSKSQALPHFPSSPSWVA